LRTVCDRDQSRSFAAFQECWQLNRHLHAPWHIKSEVEQV